VQNDRILLALTTPISSKSTHVADHYRSSDRHFEIDPRAVDRRPPHSGFALHRQRALPLLLQPIASIGGHIQVFVPSLSNPLQPRHTHNLPRDRLFVTSSNVRRGF